MLQELTLGQRATFKCPSDMCYGPSGAGGVIPPDADLIFDIELLAVGDQCAGCGRMIGRGGATRGYMR